MCACKCRYPRKPPEGARAPRGVVTGPSELGFSARAPNTPDH